MSDPKFIRASYDALTRSVQYETDDGRVMVRSGGSLCWRTNNCGNLSSPVDAKSNKPSPKRTRNWIGFAEVKNPLQHFFFIFPSYEDGREQLKASLQRKYADFTLADTVDKYADKSDPTNDTARYLAFVRDKANLESNVLIKTLSESQIETLLDAIEQMEGYHNNKDTQKEQWLVVSRLSTSNGAEPLAGAQVHLEQHGKTFPIRADEHGRLPVIPHPPAGKGSTKLKVVQPDGTWKTLLELFHHTPPKTGVLVLDMLVMAAQTLSHKAPTPAKNDKISIQYRVQPGDSLDKIANKFKTTESDIRKLNHLNGAMIYPEQTLWIGAVGTEIKQPEIRASTKRTVQRTIQTMPERAGPVPSLSAPSPSPGKSDPAFLEQLITWFSPSPVQHARGKEGKGSPLALFDPGDRRAPWMKVALKEAKDWAGKKEDEIEKNHNIHELIGAHQKMSVTPWCASFVNYCLKTSSPPYPMANRVLSSYSFAESSDCFVEIKKPIYGAIRFSKRDGGGHVCFVLGQLNGELVVLGGNQNNQIRVELVDSKSKKSERFFVPIAYQSLADVEQNNELAEFDLTAYKGSLGAAIAPGLKASEKLS